MKQTGGIEKLLWGILVGLKNFCGAYWWDRKTFVGLTGGIE
jgi:hypothetical protein